MALCLVASAQAQVALNLTLDETITLAKTESPAARIARADFDQARWRFRSFRAEYLPRFSLEGNAPGLFRAVSDVLQDDGTIRYREQSRTQSSMDLRVYQQIPQTGGRLFLSSGLGYVRQFGEFGFGEWQSEPMIIGLQQPLFQFNNMRWQRRVAPMQYEIADKGYVEAMENVAVDVTGLFFDVYLAEMNIDIADFNLAVNDTIYTLAQGRYEIGRIAEDELLQTELALLNAQTALQAANTAYDRATQELKTALGLSQSTPLDVIPPNTVPDVQVDPEKAVEEALENRSAFLALDLQELQAEREVALQRRENSFSANMNASFGLNQRAASIDNAYIDPRSQQVFSIGFDVPLYQWGRNKADLQAALAAQLETAETTALQRQALEQNIYFEALSFSRQAAQVAIAAKADTVATRRFDVARNRYGIGSIDITELFNAQQAKDSARRAYIQELRSFWVSYFQLRRLTLYDFATGERLFVEE
ncbi:MAG: hypothetical protein RhofKO_18010 [Rhodothermales bacterium]